MTHIIKTALLALTLFASPSFADDCPLCTALENGDQAEYKNLLAEGANIHATLDSIPVLGFAIDHRDVDIIKELIELGVDVNVKADAGVTALSHATLNRNGEIVRVLLDADANIDVQDDIERTPLMYAALTGDVAIIRMLIMNGANPDLKDFMGRTAWDFIGNKKRAELAFLKAIEDWDENQNVGQ